MFRRRGSRWTVMSAILLVAVSACGAHQKPSAVPNGGEPLSPAYSPVLLASGFPACSEPGDREDCERYDASLVQLLSRPELFDGRKVSVKGFTNLEFEANALYLSREMFEAGADRDAVWIDVEGMPADHGIRQDWVSLEGTFHAGPAGHFGMYSGRLGEITSIRPALMRKPVAR